VNRTELCPLCGGPNECGIAAGNSDCWCFTASVAPEVIDQIPVEERDRACVCRACASKTGRPEGSAEMPRTDPD
jgi:hypothetical protein